MEKLISNNKNALRFLMTEDIYTIPENKRETEHPSYRIKADKQTFDYSGGNNRYFLIVHEDESQDKLNEVHEEMLTKILAAKGMEVKDIALLNLAKYPKADFLQLKSFFACTRIVLFGIDPQRIALPAIPANESSNHSEVNVLATFSLAEMGNDTTKKRDFWAVMKNF